MKHIKRLISGVSTLFIIISAIYILVVLISANIYIGYGAFVLMLLLFAYAVGHTLLGD